MLKYIITFKDIPTDEVSISYASNGKLIQLDATNASTISTEQLQFLKTKVPPLLTDPYNQLLELMELCKGKLNITQSEFDVSFDTFWNAYDYKRHKKDAQRLFEKLSYIDKLKCITSCTAYFAYRKRKGWLEQQLPDTYISKREFETEWKKL